MNDFQCEACGCEVPEGCPYCEQLDRCAECSHCSHCGLGSDSVEDNLKQLGCPSFD